MIGWYGVLAGLGFGLSLGGDQGGAVGMGTATVLGSAGFLWDYWRKGDPES